MYGSTLSQRQVLRRSPLFARLGDSEIDAILAHATVARHAEGDQIFAKGDPGNSMMAVLKGRVMISAPSPDGRQVVLTVMRDGEVFGEIALLDGKERTADATAMTDCELLVVPRRSLLALLERRPDLCIELVDRIVRAIAADQRAGRGSGLPRPRSADRQGPGPARRGERRQAASPTGPVGVKISQRALGELVGGSRESVNKHLQDWKRSGIIAIEKGAIVIRDLAALAALG